MNLLQTTLLFCLLIAGSSCNGQTTPPATGNTVTQVSKSIFVVYHARNGDYWFGSDGEGVYRYDDTTVVHFSTKNGLSNNRIRDIQEDDRGNIFINTLGGISKFDGRRFEMLKSVESDTWISESNDLWFTTNQDDNGVYRYDGKALYHLKFPKHYMHDEFYRDIPNPPYNPYQTYRIYKDRNGHLWFGTSTFGVCRFDGHSLSWLYEDHLTHIGRGGSFGIRSVMEDREGKFWFCNTRYRYDIHPPVFDSLYRKEKGVNLIGYERETGIEDIKAPDGSDAVYFMSVVKDDSGDLWMSTYRQGVWRYDGETTTHYPVKDGTEDVKVYAIYKDRFEHLWLGTHEAGVYRFDGKRFVKFSIGR